MPDDQPTRTGLAPGPRDRTVQTPDGDVLDVPKGWALLPPGDAGLTRRVKAGGPTWSVQEKRGRRTFSRGVWADAQRIDQARATLETDRSSPSWQRKQAQAKARRDRAQQAYVAQFEREVLAFLAFHPRHGDLADALARQVAAHATPVGSGTVARTSRIPVQQRAEAAVIAWMRHQTTAYDHMAIARVKGRRREVRRKLAQASRRLLQRYRDGAPPAEGCPLQVAVDRAHTPGERIAVRPPLPDPDASLAKQRSIQPKATPPRKASPPSPAPLTPTTPREQAQRALYEQVRARMQAGGRRRRGRGFSPRGDGEG